MVSMTKIRSVSNEIVTMQKTMTHVLGQHNVTWLGGSWLQNRIQTMIFHYKNPSFSPICISWLSSRSPLFTFLFSLCLSAEQYYCYFCISSMKFPHHTVTQALPAPQVITEGPNRALSDRDSQKHSPSLGRGPAPLESCWTGFLLLPAI